MPRTNNKEQIELTESEKRGLVNLVTDSKEVEESLSVFQSILNQIIADEDNSEYNADYYKDYYTEIMAKALHQELQKARQSWLREEIVKLEGMKNALVKRKEEIPSVAITQTIIYLYLSLIHITRSRRSLRRGPEGWGRGKVRQR